MTSTDIRKKFLKYFEERGHVIVPSSSLIPDDTSVLLTTAGMQQFKRYYTGELDAEKTFGSRSAASVQKCFRTSDIDEVGDESHLTFFEMLGNFSFGGYFKKEAIAYAHDFLTKVMGLMIDCVTVFDPEKVPAGDWRKDVPRDDESAAEWRKLGVTDIRPDGTDVFWGPTGSEGPCGPTTEVYVRGLEVWNIVFNQFYADREQRLTPLGTPGVDTGMGLERLAMVAQEKESIFETDLFAPLLEPLPDSLSVREKRIVADHGRGIAFLISDGVEPSNKETGYVLRRLMRRLIVLMRRGLDVSRLLRAVVAGYHDFYRELDERHILDTFQRERDEFSLALERGLRELEKMKEVDAKQAFYLYQSFGLPYEVLKDVGGAKTAKLNREAFDAEYAKHQEISRAGAGKKFGGHGLALDTGELKAGTDEEMQRVVRLHTATHLLHQALRDVLHTEAPQEGSDITPERARFDFGFARKLTDEERAEVERIVNEKIKEDLPVRKVELPKEEAEQSGALHSVRDVYPDTVSVYYVGDSLDTAYSKEFCGGPHVSHTGEIGTFKITKEESAARGIRRIRFAPFRTTRRTGG